jgi:hypothetical protein
MIFPEPDVFGVTKALKKTVKAGQIRRKYILQSF